MITKQPATYASPESRIASSKYGFGIGKDFAVTESAIVIEPSEDCVDVMPRDFKPSLCQSTCVVTSLTWQFDVKHVEHCPEIRGQ